jgi:hypothetical protein
MNADKHTLRYQTGEEIRSRDRVLFHDEPAEVEFVADESSEGETGWFFQEFGGGVMIADPKVSGRSFIPATPLEEYEDLEFVSRADTRV